ncbi:MAG: hypothetical protein AB7Q81_15075 [Gammaproteobacteria bacterium]
MSGPLPTWSAELDAALAALTRAAAADDWTQALDIAADVQSHLLHVTFTPTAGELAAARRAQAALQQLADRVGACRDATAAALRDLRVGQRAVQAYR